MFKRLIGGTLKGFLIGAGVAFAGLELLGAAAGGPLEYLLALMTGLLVGLVAGKPIWAHAAKLEAGLKAAAGALLSVGVLFALRRWTNVELDLTRFGLGHGSAAELPAAALPGLGVGLAWLFELDDAAGAAHGEAQLPPGDSAGRARIAKGDERSADELELDDEQSSHRSLGKR